MSRQFDEYMSDKFEIYGELYSFVEPTNFKELMKAFEVRDAIENYYNGLMHDDDNQDSWLAVLQEQEEYIQNYLDSLGDFDNSILVSNINYLTKENGMKLGDLESIIGLSAGYISRTAKVDSKKKMSVDVVWKIAELFEVDMKALLAKDLSVPDRSIIMLKKFIEKLKQRTLSGKINWNMQGGCIYKLHPKYITMGLITDGDILFYNSDCLNKELDWTMANDIYAYEKFDGDKDLVIISVSNVNHEENRIFDFLLVWNEDNKDKWERVFCTADDCFAHLGDQAAELVDLIEGLQFEPQISVEHRNMIAAFLKEEN